MKYLISIEYDGSKYCGLQKLKGEKTVQGELEKVLTEMNQAPVRVLAAGRTDKGVHALDQKCHFEISKNVDPYRLKYYINRSTSPNLFVKDCTIIEDDNFHSRFSVKSKTYLYRINVGQYNAIQNDYLYNYNNTLCLKKMRNAAKLITGPHNFKAFVTGKHQTYESVIEYIKIKKIKSIIEIEIKGKAFYTYMVRNIVRIIILMGANKITKDEILEMLEKQMKVQEYSPVPSNGLYLKEIEY